MRIRNKKCLSEASCFCFPLFLQHWQLEREAQRLAVAFFGLPFLAKQKR